MSDLVKSGGSGLVGLLHGKNGEISIPKPFEKDIFLFDTYVAGTTHIEGIEELEPHLNNDDRLEFFREPDNRYDKQAIVIKTVDGVKIGYVPKQDNVIFARLMDAGKLLFGKRMSASTKQEKSCFLIGILLALKKRRLVVGIIIICLWLNRLKKFLIFLAI